MSEFQGPTEYAVARIGHSGGKLHPAYRPAGDAHWHIACSCPGTNNGHAYSRMTVYRGSGLSKRTCKPR